MMRSINELISYVLSATDGEIGRCKDFLFDDELWTVRYMVADTGKWLPGRKVLVSPIALGTPEWRNHRFPVNLSKAEIENSPPLEEHAPVSRKYEIKYFNHYYWPYYWTGGETWGAMPNPPPVSSRQARTIEETDEEPDKSHLRSAKEVMGYHIRAADGEIGHVEDYIADEGTWTIRYMVVDTRNWLPGRKVLVSPSWIDTVSWRERIVEVNLTSETIRESPEYDPAQPVNREYETRLYDFYGRPVYWK